MSSVGKGNALPLAPAWVAGGALCSGSWHVWGWEHRVGIGRRIIYVSRIYESFSVQIAVLDFSSVGKLLWLLELEQKRAP